MTFSLKDTAEINTSKNAETATKLETGRNIDGVMFDGSANIVHYALCSTEAGVGAKTATITGFSLAEGSIAYVIFSYTNTADAPTLNVNSTGDKDIYFGTHRITGGDIEGGYVYILLYDGTQYRIVNGSSNLMLINEWSTYSWGQSRYPY